MYNRSFVRSSLKGLFILKLFLLIIYSFISSTSVLGSPSSLRGIKLVLAVSILLIRVLKLGDSFVMVTRGWVPVILDKSVHQVTTWPEWSIMLMGLTVAHWGVMVMSAMSHMSNLDIYRSPMAPLWESSCSIFP